MKDDPFPFLLEVPYIVLGTITIPIIIGVVIVVILILLSAIVSGSEVSFFSLDSNDLKDIESYDKSKEVRIRKLLSNPNKLLATILIANNFINVSIIILSAYLTSRIFVFSSDAIKFFVEVIVITFVLVLLAEITPKVYAKKHSALFSKNVLFLIRLLDRLFAPFSRILISSTSIIDKRLKKRSEKISINEISKAIDLTENQDKDEDDKRMLRSILEFGNIDVKEIMNPRTDVVSLDIHFSYQEVLNIIESCSFSRIPVFDKTLDSIKGVLHIKDLIPHILDEDVDWGALCHEPFFVPETKRINELLREFQEKKVHLAIVVDEYGGTSGIVTLEDVLEEIVGEINDEFDDDGERYSRIDDHTFIFEAKTSLNDFLKIVGGDFDYFDNIKGDADTIAGLILEKTRVLPEVQNHVEIFPYEFIIESVDDRKINRVKVIVKK